MELVSNDIPYCVAFVLEFLLGREASHESSSENDGAATTEELHTAIEEHIAQNQRSGEQA